MTKRYELIPLNGFLYGVDKEALSMGDEHVYCPEGRIKSVCSDDESQTTDIKIIATNDPSLGLPLLPEIEEDIDSALEKEFNCKKDLFQQKEWNWMKRAYKAAKAKAYTEEDIEEAVEIGMRSAAHNTLEERIHYFKQWYERKHGKPLPIAVEVEEWGDWAAGTEYEQKGSIKIENGFVKVKQWIYD